MEKEQIIKVQMLFRKIFTIMWTILAASNFITYMVFEVLDKENLICLVAVSVFILADILLNKFVSLDKNLLLIILRSFTVVGFIAYIALQPVSYRMGMCLLLCAIFILETAVVCDFSDAVTKNASIILSAVVIFIENVIGIFLDKDFNSEKAMFLVCMYCAYLLYTYLAYTTVSKMIQYFDKKVFAQARLIDEINNTNDELIKNQEKVNRTNELLGLQKVKLEAAYRQIKRINSEMAIQNDIVKYISTSLDINKLLTIVTESIMAEINVELCAIMVNEQVFEGDEIIYKISTKYSDGFVEGFTSFIKHGKFPKDFEGAHIIVDNNVVPKNYEELGTNLLGSMLCIPLELNGEVIGKFYVGSARFGFFNDNIAFYETIVAQINIAINNASMFFKMQNMANRDGLTGIYNRRYLNHTYQSFVEEVEKTGQAMTVILLDIDKFKKINDTYGHLFGDEVIQKVASMLEEYMKPHKALIARYGGEEFVAVIKNKSYKEIMDSLELLHKSIAEHEFILNGSSIYTSVSVGVSSYPALSKKPYDLLTRADRAMYYSKEHGRNRITIDDEKLFE